MVKIKRRTLRIKRPRRSNKHRKYGLKKHNRTRKRCSCKTRCRKCTRKRRVTNKQKRTKRKRTKRYPLRKKRNTKRRRRRHRVKTRMKGGSLQVPILSDLFAMTSNNTGNFFNALKGNHTTTSSLPNAQALPRYVKNPPLFP